MGTDMQSLMNAYQGFAKGNYTMLDNLSLGFGGTKEGMERLLAWAEELSGKKFDISSYADIVEAIHIVQEKMEISGTTAEEASETITGAAGSMKAAWENLVTALADPEADVGSKIEAFVESTKTMLQNVIPTANNAIEGIKKLVEEVSPLLVTELPNLIKDTLPGLLSAGVDLVKAVGSALVKTVPILAPMVKDLLVKVVSTVTQNAPAVIKAATELIKKFADMFASNAHRFIKLGLDMILSIVDGISENLPAILDAALTIIEALMQGLVDNFPKLVESALLLIENLADFLIEALPELIPAAVGMIVEIAKTLTEPENIQRLISCAVDLILALVDGLLDALPILIEALPEIITNLVEGLTSEESIGKIIDGMIEIVGKLAEWLLDPENLAMLVVAAGQIIWALIKGMVNVQVEIWKTLGSILAECGRTVYEYGEKAFNWGKELIQSIIEGIKSMAGEIGDAISDIIPDGVKDFISGGKDLIGKGASKLSGLFHAEGGVTAHATGGYLINSPVLTTGGDLFGEAGREAILPLDTNTEWMDKLAERINSNNVAPVVIQEVNINFPEGITIGSDYDTDRMIERISEQLSNLQMAQTAAIGGANW